MDGERDDRRGARDSRRDVDGTSPARDARRDAYVAEISARLRHVCQHLPDDEFTRLVLDMAETKLRFAAIEAGAFSRPRPGPTPVKDSPSADDRAPGA